MKKTVLALLLIILAPLFLVGVTTSAPYNPWCDMDDDGDIDIYDVVEMADRYDTAGNPGKNVTIVGRANKLAYSVEEVTVNPEGGFVTPWISVDGYAKVTISVATDAYQNYVLVMAWHEPRPLGWWGFPLDEQYDIPSFLVKTYDVPNKMIQVGLGNDDGIPKLAWIDVYLIS